MNGSDVPELLSYLKKLFINGNSNNKDSIDDANKQLEKFRANERCCAICMHTVTALLRIDQQGVVYGIHVDPTLRAIALVFCLQSIYEVIKSRNFFKFVSIEQARDMVRCLLNELDLLKDDSSSTGFKVRTQLCICISCLAVKGADFQWTPAEVFNTYFAMSSVPLIQMELFSTLAEELENDKISLRQDYRHAVFLEMKQRGETLIQYFFQLLTSPSSNDASHVRVLRAISGWIHLGLFSPKEVMNSQIMILIFDRVFSFCRNFQSINHVGVQILSVYFELIRQFCKLVRTPFSIHPYLKPCFEEWDINQRAALLKYLEDRIVPMTYSLASLVRSLSTANDEMLERLSVNMTTSIAVMAKTCIHWWVHQMEQADKPDYIPSTEVFTALAECTACTQLNELSSASFDFWYECIEVIERYHTHSQGPRVEHLLVPHLGNVLLLLTRAVCQFPCDEVVENTWTDMERDNFKIYRRDARDLMRALIQPVPRANEPLSTMPNHYARSVHQLVLQWEEEEMRALHSGSQILEWRSIESLMHGLSAMSRIFTSEHYEVLGKTFQSIGRVMEFCYKQPHVRVHRVFLRTLAILIGVYGNVPDAQLQENAAFFQNSAILCLHVAEEDPSYPFRDGEDHCGAVALLKMCLQDDIATQIASSALNHSDEAVMTILRVVDKGLVDILAPRQDHAIAYMSLQQISQQSSGSLMSYRSFDLVLQALCIILLRLEQTPLKERVANCVLTRIAELIDCLSHHEIKPERVKLGCEGLRLLSCICDAFALYGTNKVDNQQIFLIPIIQFLMPKVLVVLRVYCDDSSVPIPVGERDAITLYATKSLMGMAKMCPAATRDIIMVMIPIIESRLTSWHSGRLSDFDVSFVEIISFFVQASELPVDLLEQLAILIMKMSESIAHNFASGNALHSQVSSVVASFFLLCRRYVEKWGTATRSPVTPTIDNYMSHALGHAIKCVIACQRNSNVDPSLLDQACVLEMVKFERVFVLGDHHDGVDVFTRLPNFSNEYLLIRDAIMKVYGATLLESIMIGMVGSLPSWTLDRLNLIFRACCAQYREFYFNWLIEVVSKPHIPRPGIKANAKKEFLDKIQQLETIQNVNELKRMMKTFCGGKRKGDASKKPKTKDR